MPVTLVVIASLLLGGLAALAYFVFALRGRKPRAPQARRCPSCGNRQGVKGRPIHLTPGEPPVSWGILCEPCWQVMPIRRRYEFYALAAQEQGLERSPEWASIRAAVEVGL